MSELPAFNLGDPIYVCQAWNNRVVDSSITVTITRRWLNRDGTQTERTEYRQAVGFMGGFGEVKQSDWGKTLFATREEAEAALPGLVATAKAEEKRRLDAEIENLQRERDRI